MDMYNGRSKNKQEWNPILFISLKGLIWFNLMEHKLFAFIWKIELHFVSYHFYHLLQDYVISNQYLFNLMKVYDISKVKNIENLLFITNIQIICWICITCLLLFLYQFCFTKISESRWKYVDTLIQVFFRRCRLIRFC